MFKTLLCALLLAALTAFTAAADTDFTGRWTGSAKISSPEGETQDSPAIMVLKQEGSAVTGIAGPDEPQALQISEGKAEGAKLTFVVKGENELRVTFAMALEGDHLKGEANMERNGQTRKIALDLTRVK
jgi:hypothetical protein